MADVTLTYKGSDILELSDSGSATLKTGGKYCEDDIEVEYVKPSGGGNVPQYYKYTHAEDWTTDATGNLKTFADTYCANGYGIYRVTVKNNDGAGIYRAISLSLIALPYGYAANNQQYYVTRAARAQNVGTSSGSASLATNVSFYMLSGAIVKVNYWPLEERSYP